MNLRIIAGEFGGRRLDAHVTSRTHPMGERPRGAMFNSLAGSIDGARVLDAYAGTGAIGFEALSRGASHAVFVERDRIAQKILASNIAALGVEARTDLVRTSVSNWLDTYSGEPFDLIFVDPPYHDPQFSTVSRIFDLLKPKGLMVLSHIGRSEVPTKTGVVVVDNRSYGNAHLTFYRRVE